MGLFGIGRGSGQHEQAERNGQRAWEELQETREEVQGALQHEAGHVKEKADEQARGVKEQLEHLKGKAGGAAERGRQRGEQHADEVAEKASDTGSRLKRGTERGANAVAERASGTIDTVRDKAWQIKEGVKEKARRAEETVEEQSQHAKQEVKGKWWEKREKADRAAEETAQKMWSNIHAAEQTAAEKADDAKRAAAEKAEQAQEAAQRGAQKVKGAAERSKEKLGEVKDKVGEKGQKLKGRVEETAEDLEEDAERTREAATRKAEEAKRTAAKPVWWLGRKADEGTDKIAEGVGAAKGVVSGTAQEAKEAGRGLGAKLDRAADKVVEGAGYTAGYVEGTAEEVAQGAKHALERTRDVVGDDVRVTVKRVETPFISIHSKTVKELLAGGIAGAIAQTAATPLEVVRTKLLGGRAGDNVKEVVKTLNRKSGRNWPIKQTTGSFGINVLRVALTKSVELVTYEKVKAKLKRRGRPGDHQIPLLDKLPRQVPESTWAGMAAGLANTLVAYPFETLKDRVLVMPEKYKGFGDALREVMLHEGGLPALYRGVVPALLGIVPQSAVNYYTYDTLKERYRKRTGRKHVPAGYTLLFGATAGAVSQLATYPLEVARKQVSVSVLPAVETGKAANAAYRNVVEAVRGVVRTEGVAGLYKGVGAQVAQVVPVAGLSWVVFETAKRALHAEEEDEDED